MPSTYRAIEGILTLLQLVPIVVLSVYSLRVRHLLLAPSRQAPPVRYRLKPSLLSGEEPAPLQLHQ